MPGLPFIAQGYPAAQGKRTGSKASYDFPQENTAEVLQAKVLQSIAGHQHGGKAGSRHAGVDEVTTWMRAEKARAADRADKRWRKKFEAWQQKIVAQGKNAYDAPKDERGRGAKGMGNRQGSLPELPSKRRGLSGSSSLPSIRQGVSLGDAGFLEQEANKRAAEKQAKRDAKEAERQRLREIELNKLRDDMEGAKKQHAHKRQEVDTLQEELKRLADILRAECMECIRYERRIQETARVRDAWRESASRQEEKLRQNLQEKKNTTSKLEELGALVRDLEARSTAGSEPISLDKELRPAVNEEMHVAATKLQARARGRQAKAQVTEKRRQIAVAKASEETQQRGVALQARSKSMPSLDQGSAAFQSEPQNQPATTRAFTERQDSPKFTSSPSTSPQGVSRGRDDLASGASSRETNNARDPNGREVATVLPTPTARAQSRKTFDSGEGSEVHLPQRTRMVSFSEVPETEQEADVDSERRREAQAALESALLGPEHKEQELKSNAQAALEDALFGDEEKRKATAKTNAKAALEAALLADDPEEKKIAAKKKAKVALEATLLADDDGRPASEEGRKRAQAALEAALLENDDAGTESEEEESKRQAQAALEAALLGTDEPEDESERASKEKAQAALEAALLEPDEEDEQKQKAQAAIEAALLDSSEEDEQKQKAQAAIEAALLDSSGEGEQKQQARAALEAALLADDDTQASGDQKRQAQEALEKALLSSPEELKKDSAKRNVKAALEAALLDSDDNDEAGTSGSRQLSPEEQQRRKQAQDALEAALLADDEDTDKQRAQAQAALEAALLGADDDDDEDQRKSAQAALEAALLGMDADEAHKQKARDALEAALFGSDAADDDRVETAKRTAKDALEAALLDDDRYVEERKKKDAKKNAKAALEAALCGSDDEREEQSKKQAQAALEAALFDTDDAAEDNNPDEEKKRANAQAALEAALFEDADTEDAAADKKQRAQAQSALEAALLADDEADEASDQQSRERAQAALEAALLGSSEGDEQKQKAQSALEAALLGQEDEGLLQDEKRRQAQTALEKSLLSSPQELKKDKAKRNAKAALEAALLDSDDDVEAAPPPLSDDEQQQRRQAQDALEAALLGTEDEDDEHQRMQAQEALEAALLEFDADDEHKQKARDALEAALFDSSDDDQRKSAQAALEAALLDASDENATASKDADVKVLGRQAKASLEKALASGVLADMVQKSVEAAEPQDQQPDLKQEKTVVLGSAPVATNKKSASSVPPEMLRLKDKARTSLTKASKDGSLKDAFLAAGPEEKASSSDAPQAEIGPNGPQVGDLVEVYSNSKKAWCPGEIEALGKSGDKMVKVVYSDGSMMYSKVIEWGHANIRRRSDRAVSSEVMSAQETEMKRRRENRYQVGDKIEIFSNTNKQWCKGEVISVDGSPEEGQMANCVYVTNSGQEMSKKIAMGHANMRFDEAYSEAGSNSRPPSSMGDSRPGSQQQDSRPGSSQQLSRPGSLAMENRPGSSSKSVRIAEHPQLSESKSTPALAAQELQAESIGNIREKARADLTEASQDGRLAGSLREHAPPEEPPQ